MPGGREDKRADAGDRRTVGQRGTADQRPPVGNHHKTPHGRVGAGTTPCRSLHCAWHTAKPVLASDWNFRPGGGGTGRVEPEPLDDGGYAALRRTHPARDRIGTRDWSSRVTVIRFTVSRLDARLSGGLGDLHTVDRGGDLTGHGAWTRPTHGLESRCPRLALR